MATVLTVNLIFASFSVLFGEADMKIDHLILGAFETNCYVLRESEEAKECVVIDSGLDGTGMIDFLMREDLKVGAVILTHGHADHIHGVGLIRENYPGCKVYIHDGDADMLTDSRENLSAAAGVNFSTDPADFILRGGEELVFGEIRLRVLHTPGHTRGGICLYCDDEKILFSGDTLFADSIGRTDFPGGNMEKLIGGIKEKLMVLGDEVKVCPGHGPFTTIGRERKFNQYLQ